MLPVAIFLLIFGILAFVFVMTVALYYSVLSVAIFLLIFGILAFVFVMTVALSGFDGNKKTTKEVPPIE